MQYFFLNKLYNPGQAASSIYPPKTIVVLAVVLGYMEEAT